MYDYYARLKNKETGMEWITHIHTTEILFEGDEILVDDQVNQIIKIKEEV